MTQTTTPSIIWQEQIITIKDSNHQPRKITAMVGLGTGLAYHLQVFEDGRQGKEYGLTHVESGYGLCALCVPTPEEAQAWIEMIGNLDKDLPTLKRMMQRGLRARVEMAHERASLPRNQVFMYAVDRDGCPLFPTQDTEKDAEDNAEKAAYLFAYHARTAASVVLVEMDYRDGRHTVLHTYTRQEVK